MPMLIPAIIDNFIDMKQDWFVKLLLSFSIFVKTMLLSFPIFVAIFHKIIFFLKLEFPSKTFNQLFSIKMSEKLCLQWNDKIASGLQLAYICKVCGKEGEGRNLKDHIESKHLEGIVIPCNFCRKTFKTRNSLRYHKSQFHKN